MAAVSATGMTNGSAAALVDGIIAHRQIGFLSDAVFAGEAAVVTLRFDAPKTICAVMAYGDSGNFLEGVRSIRLHLASGGSICYRGSACLQLNPLEVTAIELTMPASDTPYTASEIVVMSNI